MKSEETTPPKMPPRWLVHGAWRVHRALYKLSGGRFLWATSNKRGWGALRLAMNGWDEGHPAWWLNLRAQPDAVVRLTGQEPRPVHAPSVEGPQRDRLWRRWAAVEPKLDGYASTRSTKTPVVVLEPRAQTEPESA